MFSTSPTMLFLYCSTSNTTLASLAPVARSTSANSESRFLTGQLLTGTHVGPPLQFLTQRVVDGLAYALQASSAEINSDSRRSKFQLPLNGSNCDFSSDSRSPCCTSRKLKPPSVFATSLPAENLSPLNGARESSQSRERSRPPNPPPVAYVCALQTRLNSKRSRKRCACGGGGTSRCTWGDGWTGQQSGSGFSDLAPSILYYNWF